MRNAIFCGFLILFLVSSCRTEYEGLSHTNVNEEPVLINLSGLTQSTTLHLKTSEDRVLAFTNTVGSIAELSNFIKIYDGNNISASTILLDASSSHRTIYSTGNSAVLEIITNIPYKTHLKIQKAANCPSDLGTNSSCSRMVDAVSCYCVVNNVGTWRDQNRFCLGHKFQLLSIESPFEETAIYDILGRVTYYWTSLNDLDTENVFVWGSTGVPLNPGYTNWHLNQPDGSRSCETPEDDCVHLNFLNGGWNDAPCSYEYEAICERQP